MKHYFEVSPFYALPLEGYLNRYKDQNFILGIFFKGNRSFALPPTIYNYAWLAAGVDYFQTFLIKDGSEARHRKVHHVFINGYLKSHGSEDIDGEQTNIFAHVLDYVCSLDKTLEFVRSGNTNLGVLVEIHNGSRGKLDIQVAFVPKSDFQMRIDYLMKFGTSLKDIIKDINEQRA